MLPEGLHMRLRRFVAVCVLSIYGSLSHCALADIVYSVSESGANNPLIDLDRDGSSDLTIRSTIKFCQPGGTIYSLSLDVPQWNTSEHAGLSRAADGFLVRLTGGETIGPEITEPWKWTELDGNNGVISSRINLPWTDSWATQPIGLLGVRLQREQDLHYGWLRIDLSGNHDHLHYQAKVIDFAYESTPNTTIIAGAVPEPATWLLIVAAAAIFAGCKLRRRLLPF
jgi:hypothetical protein